MRYGTYEELEVQRAKRRGRSSRILLQIDGWGTDAQHVFLPLLVSHPRQSKTTPKKFKKNLTNISRAATTRTRESGNLLLVHSRRYWPSTRNRCPPTPKVVRLATSGEDSHYLSPYVPLYCLVFHVRLALTCRNVVPNRPRVPIQGYEDEQ